MDELAAQIGAERGTTLNLIPDGADRQRAQQIPFRGNPSDVDIVEIDGVRKVVVPLGGPAVPPGPIPPLPSAAKAGEGRAMSVAVANARPSAALSLFFGLASDVWGNVTVSFVGLRG